jgi:hypothetical protein
MIVQHILQLIAIHKTNNVESSLIFDKTNDLDIINFGEFNIFKELMVKDGKCRNFT